MAEGNNNNNNKFLVSGEMKEIKVKISSIILEQKELKHKLREHAKKVIEGKFQDSLLETLEQLERQEVDLENQHINLRKSLLEATQKERRVRLQEASAKLKKDGPTSADSSSNTIFSNSVAAKSLDELSTRVFGKSSRAALKGPNPFLQEGEQV